MDYKKIYDSIINKRLSQIIERTETFYTEKHHIIPRSLGGSDEQSNIIILTPREHFICHCLLAKMYKYESNEWFKMNNAINAMSMKPNKNRYINGRIYEKIKSEYFSAVRREKEKKHLITINKVIDFIEKHNKVPSFSKSNSNLENKYATFLTCLRQAKSGSRMSKWVFRESYQKLAEERNVGTLFNLRDFEKSNLEWIREELIPLLKNNNTLYESLSISEKKKNTHLINYPKNTTKWKNINRKLNILKQSRNGETVMIFYKSYDDEVNNIDSFYPTIFMTIKQRFNIKTKELREFVKKHNRLPKQKNKMEHRLNSTFYKLSESKKIKILNSIKHVDFVDEVEKLCISMKNPDLSKRPKAQNYGGNKEQVYLINIKAKLKYKLIRNDIDKKVENVIKKHNLSEKLLRI